MYKKALRWKLRFDHPKGNLNCESLWDLTLSDLNTMAKKYHKELESEDEIDFLANLPPVSKTLQLKFDIVMDVLETKKEESEGRKLAASKREEKSQLLNILAEKQSESLRNLSEEEILKKLKDLG